MTRARISENGIEVAKPGYDVDTAALHQMILSPQFTTMRVALTGVVTVGTLTGIWGSIYDWAQIYFPSNLVFNNPPIVLVAGQNSDGSTDQTPFYYRSLGSNGELTWMPHYSIETFPDHFELYVLKSASWIGTIPRTWKYFVFANTLDP